MYNICRSRLFQVNSTTEKLINNWSFCIIIVAKSFKHSCRFSPNHTGSTKGGKCKQRSLQWTHRGPFDLSAQSLRNCHRCLPSFRQEDYSLRHWVNKNSKLLCELLQQFWLHALPTATEQRPSVTHLLHPLIESVTSLDQEEGNVKAAIRCR